MKALSKYCADWIDKLRLRRVNNNISTLNEMLRNGFGPRDNGKILAAMDIMIARQRSIGRKIESRKLRYQLRVEAR